METKPHIIMWMMELSQTFYIRILLLISLLIRFHIDGAMYVKQFFGAHNSPIANASIIIILDSPLEDSRGQ